MALPSLDHTWRFKVNQALPTSGDALTDNRTLLLAIKNSLITASGWTDSAGAAATLTTPWTVVASSNGVTADGNDNWGGLSDLVFATGDHSWIVLRQTGINGQNIELCIDLNDATVQGYELSVTTSLGSGFDVSSPSLSARPVADDQINWIIGSWFSGASAAYSSVLNVCISDDGQCNRIWGLIGGFVKNLWLFDKPKNTVTGWTNPSVTIVTGSFQVPGYAVLNDTQRAYIKATDWLGVTRIGGCYCSTEFYVDGCLGQRQTVANNISGEWSFNKIGLTCGTPGLYGRHGELSDIWYGSTGPVDGDCYPDTGTVQQFIQVGSVILPWNQSAPVTS